MLKKISIKAKKIEVVKDWPKPKSVCNIQDFLSFANFYWQFIQGFSKIAAPFILMLKITGLSNKPAISRNNGKRSASSRHNNNRPDFKKNDGNGKFDIFGDVDMKHAKKSGKS